ncbi:MAG TPA: hypothetical protein VFX16_08485 [Pseudonocardiaceae bacterium]|nr:hypothetical protein [Pseudonocardiaceae bacterium]
MTAPTRGDVLHAIRTALTLSQPAFVEFLKANGLRGRLSRQLLSKVEKGDADFAVAVWEDVVDALLAGGVPAADVAALRPVEPTMLPAPDNTPAFRRSQWQTLADRLPSSRWWRHLGRLTLQVAGKEWETRFDQLQREHDIDPEAVLAEVKRLLELGGTPAGAGTPMPGDRVALEGDESARTARGGRQGLVLFRVRLRNAGTVLWRDRMLYRLGAPVTSELPFVPALVPVPATEPGESCEIFVPCRAQFLRSLAVISYVMVFADCSVCVSGRLQLYVDTQGVRFER